MNILVDSSVWIDLFNGSKTPETEKLEKLIRNDEQVCLSPTILQEVLQGFKTDSDYETAKNLLMAFPILIVDTLDLAIQAADLYRGLRKKGITINTSNDCLIAMTAKNMKCSILSSDKDLKKIIKHLNLPI